ncbi:MAG: PHP domain-containing protein [Simkaniaceae bacterium]|nr:PHP domain-containing protein [Simkaniaceae bacterium]
MTFKADLHIHTTCSDGTLTPTEVLHLAKEIGLSALSITDHDTIDAYTPSLFSLAEELQLFLKTGVELSAQHQEESVHVLGYSFPSDSKLMRDFCAEHQHRRHRRTLGMLDKLKKEGMDIKESELLGKGTIGRPHIAEQMVAKGYVKTMKEAFQLYLGDQQSCYVIGELFSVQETLDLIHEAGGKAFLAHPALIKNQKKLRDLLTMDFDGIECYYGNFSNEIKEKWRRVALERRWLVSGGSDFHGARMSDVPLGLATVDKATFFSF